MEKLRIGLFGAQASNKGLGIQTWEFFRHIKPAKTVVIDISDLNGMPVFPERFPGAVVHKGLPTMELIDEFLKDLDLVFTCETPYDWELGYYLFHTARKLGIKTVLAPNWEFSDYHQRPNLPKPDLFALPSMWHWEEFPYANKTFLPVPVDKTRIEARQITEARIFLHIAGKPANQDRNGTRIVIEAARLIPWAQFIIRIQDRGYIKSDIPANVQIIEENVDNYWDMYKTGDVLVMPRRYGGLCLPVNEALAAGMPVIMPNIDPNNRWLPEDWLVPAKNIGEITDRTPIDVMSATPYDLAQKIYEFATDKNFGFQSIKASRIADEISWRAMKPRYLKVFSDLCRS
ncbi:MAG: glycosyltransferase [Bacteroidota bacterium]